MARFTADQADNYGGNGGAGFFQLKNDKETARVRIMYNTMNDVEGIACHQIEIDGKKRYVNCIREYNQPMDNCPFCEAKKFQVAKLFIPIYDIDEDRVKIWERGKQFFAKISSLMSRYTNKDTDLVNHIFEIERNGKPNSTSTTYEIYEIEKDGTSLEDLPEMPQIIGGLVLDKSFEDMEYYLDNGVFPDTDNNEEEAPRRGESRGRDSESNVSRRGEGRRTPASRSREDEF